MWQLLRRELIDNLLWLVLTLVAFGIVVAVLAAGVPEASVGWDCASCVEAAIVRASLIVGTVGWLLAYLLGQSQVRTARWRGLSDHLTVLPVRRLTVDLVRTAMGLVLLAIGIGLPVGVLLAWITIADIRPMPLYCDEAFATWARVLSSLLPAYAGGLCFGRGSIWRTLLGVPVLMVLEWYCHGQAVISVELARVLVAGALLAVTLLADSPRTLWLRRALVTALVVLVWQTPLAVVRASLDRSPTYLWDRVGVVLDGAGNPRTGSGESLFWQFGEALIPAQRCMASSAGRTHASAQWRWWLRPWGAAHYWLERQGPVEPPAGGFDFEPAEHPTLWVRPLPMSNPWSVYETLMRRHRVLWLEWLAGFGYISWGPGGYVRPVDRTTLVYPNHRTGLLELHKLSTDDEGRRVRRIVAYAGRHEVADTDQIEPFPPGTIGLPGKTSIPLAGTMHHTLVWFGPDATVEVDFANQKVAEAPFDTPNYRLPLPPQVLINPTRWDFLWLDTGRFYFPWSADAVGGSENDDPLWRTDWPEALARARLNGKLGPPTLWSDGRMPTVAETGRLDWRVQPDDLGQWHEVNVPGPWCPFVNLVQFTPLSDDGSPAGSVRTAQLWLDPERNGNWPGSVGYVSGCVLATLSPPAVLLSSLVMPPAYTAQEWQQCVLQEPLISACLDKRFDRWPETTPERLGGDAERVRLFMASIATPIVLWSVAIGSLLGWHVKRQHRPYEKRPGEAGRWFLTVLLLGIPGWIVYRIFRPREALLNCPRCGRLRSPATLTCPFCNAPWTPAQRLDTDINHVEAPAAIQTHPKAEPVVPAP